MHTGFVYQSLEGRDHSSETECGGMDVRQLLIVDVCLLNVYVRLPCVQKYATNVAIEMHNNIRKQDSVY